MKVILREDVQHLGNVGEIVSVKPGYARNYLLPRGMASIADERNVKKIEHERRVIARQLEAMKASALEQAKSVEGVVITLPVKVGEQDKLYGSISSKDIEAALKAEGVKIPRKQIRLDQPIKSLGVYKVPVRLHPEVSPALSLWIVAE